MSNKFLTIWDVSERYQARPETIRKRAKRGQLPKPIRVGNRDLWSASTLEEWEKETM